MEIGGRRREKGGNEEEKGRDSYEWKECETRDVNNSVSSMTVYCLHTGTIALQF